MNAHFSCLSVSPPLLFPTHLWTKENSILISHWWRTHQAIMAQIHPARPDGRSLTQGVFLQGLSMGLLWETQTQEAPDDITECLQVFMYNRLSMCMFGFAWCKWLDALGSWTPAKVKSDSSVLGIFTVFPSCLLLQLTVYHEDGHLGKSIHRDTQFCKLPETFFCCCRLSFFCLFVCFYRNEERSKSNLSSRWSWTCSFSVMWQHGCGIMNLDA